MELVSSTENGLVTSSRIVAAYFGKRHDHVLRDIDVKLGQPNFGDTLRAMFFETTYIHEQNKQEYREVLMNRDGFTLLAMGFTGPKALEFQLDFINEFNRMEQALKERTRIPMNPMEALELMFQQAKIQQEQVEEVKADIEYLKNEVKISSQQAGALGQLVSRKVQESMKRYCFPGTRSNKKELFKAINGDIKKYAGTTARCEIKAKQFDDVYSFILDWEPSYLLIKQLEWK